MIHAVLSVPAVMRDSGVRIINVPAQRTITGAGRTYLAYVVDHGDGDLTCVDPIDGELLTELRYFNSEPEAHEWITQDIRRRAVSQVAGGRDRCAR